MCATGSPITAFKAQLGHSSATGFGTTIISTHRRTSCPGPSAHTHLRHFARGRDLPPRRREVHHSDPYFASGKTRAITGKANG
jgi:hypothetical protein